MTITNNVNLQVRNNGRTYYIINEAYLPVNPVIDGRPLERNASARIADVPGKAKKKKYR